MKNIQDRNLIFINKKKITRLQQDIDKTCFGVLKPLILRI